MLRVVVAGRYLVYVSTIQQTLSQTMLGLTRDRVWPLASPYGGYLRDAAPLRRREHARRTVRAVDFTIRYSRTELRTRMCRGGGRPLPRGLGLGGGGGAGGGGGLRGGLCGSGVLLGALGPGLRLSRMLGVRERLEGGVLAAQHCPQTAHALDEYLRRKARRHSGEDVSVVMPRNTAWRCHGARTSSDARAKEMRTNGQAGALSRPV
jgi:hypothetical protein